MLAVKVARGVMVDDEFMDDWKPSILFDDGTALEMVQDEQRNGPGRCAYID